MRRGRVTADHKVELLRQVRLFQGLSRKDLATVARAAKEVSYAAGRDITTQGRGGTGFHVIVEGAANVIINGRTQQRLGPGDHFGEIAVIDGGPRSATVTAESEVRTLALTTWEFRPLLQENPHIAIKLLEQLARWLREAQRDPASVL